MPLKVIAGLLLKFQEHYFHRFVLVILLSLTLLSICTAQKATTKANALAFKKHIVHSNFISEGVTTGDVNNDGRIDILAGQYWFEAPLWKRHLLHADTTDPIPGYSTTFLNYSADVNGDGWIDLIRFDQPGAACLWYENPKNAKGLWQRHLIAEVQGNETPAFVDVDGDGKKDIICNDSRAKQVVWLKSPAEERDSLWQHFVISHDSTIGTDKYTHGLGWGDVNKDGRNDVIIKDGWWEAPADVTKTDWTFHKADFGKDCANMFAWDVDKDGDQDILSSSAHNYGIWWYEQKQNSTGSTTWVMHEISKRFSQSHALALVDINSDGHPDLVTGKRYWAHNGKDPGEYEPAVLYWFEYKAGKTPRWIPHEIDTNSGVGTNIAVQDITGDKLPDIVISNKKGVFFFEQTKR